MQVATRQVRTPLLSRSREGRFSRGESWKERGRWGMPAHIELILLRCDQGFQGNAVGNHKSRAALLDKTLLLEACEKPADGLSRGANHLSDLFVSEGQLHLAGVLGFSVLVEPSHHQPRKLFAGGVGKDQVTDLAASAGVILTDVLGDPQGDF